MLGAADGLIDALTYDADGHNEASRALARVAAMATAGEGWRMAATRDPTFEAACWGLYGDKLREASHRPFTPRELREIEAYLEGCYQRRAFIQASPLDLLRLVRMARRAAKG